MIEEFLKAQNERLQAKTFREYDSVMEIFQVYLKTYAGWEFSEAESDFIENVEMPDGLSILSLVRPKHLSEPILAEFFEFFLIRKVMSDETFMKQAVRVIKKFVKWLLDQDYITAELYSELKAYFSDNNKAASLPNVEKLANLLYRFTAKAPNRDYTEEDEGYFIITKIEPNQLWLENYTELNTVGPINLSKEILDLCEEDWQISGMVGKNDGTWYFIETWNVYPSS